MGTQADVAREKLIERIRKMLAKADQTKNDSVEEAAAAAAMAANLMAQHNIDQAEVIREELRHPEHIIFRDVYANVNFGVASKVPQFAQTIGVIVAQLFDCEASLARNAKFGVCIRVFGYQTDVEVAAWTFDYLMGAVRRASKEFRATLTTRGITAHAQKQFSISFRQGMASRIVERLQDRLDEKRCQDERDLAATPGTALIVVKKDAIVAKFGGFSYRQNRPRVADADAYWQGVAEGDRVNLTPNAISSPTA